jgi:ATP-dependent RNA helicase RhlE
MTFEELNLAPAILKAVLEQGYETPTPIQAQAIPAVLEGHDLLAGAQTGTGKTAAFTLPMLHRLSQGTAPKNKFGGKGIRALVLTPPANWPPRSKSRCAITANTWTSTPPWSLAAWA